MFLDGNRVISIEETIVTNRVTDIQHPLSFLTKDFIAQVVVSQSQKSFRVQISIVVSEDHMKQGESTTCHFFPSIVIQKVAFLHSVFDFLGVSYIDSSRTITTDDMSTMLLEEFHNDLN